MKVILKIFAFGLYLDFVSAILNDSRIFCERRCEEIIFFSRKMNDNYAIKEFLFLQSDYREIIYISGRFIQNFL